MTRRRIVPVMVYGVLAFASLVAAQSGRTLDDRAMRAYLERVHGQSGMMNVPKIDGEFLHDYILKHNYRRGLEIGTSNGYSAIWMGLALRRTGGTLVTLEIDTRRADLAEENFKNAGLTEFIELRRGDALKLIPDIKGPFDFVFIDAWKEDYITYLNLVLPKVRSGGAIIAHNVLSHSAELKEFVRTVQNHPELETHIDRRSFAGMTVSRKR